MNYKVSTTEEMAEPAFPLLLKEVKRIEKLIACLKPKNNF